MGLTCPWPRHWTTSCLENLICESDDAIKIMHFDTYLVIICPLDGFTLRMWVKKIKKKLMDKYFNFLSSMYNVKVISYCVGLLSFVFIRAM